MSAGIAAGTWLLGGAVLGSAYIGSKASGDAAQSSADAAGVSARLQNEQYQQTREDLTPYRDAANAALPQLTNYGPSKVSEGDYIPASNIPEFNPDQFDLYKDPSYDWRVSEQERAINRNMAGMGQVTSGNRLEEIMARSGQMASQEYGAARGRWVGDYNINRANEATGYARGVDAYGRAYGQEGDYLNRLAALSNIGQTATQAGGQFGATAAANAGNAAIAAGQAQAAGQIGQANAITGAVGDLTSLYAMNQYSQPPPIQMGYNNFSPQGPMQPPGYY